MKDNVSALIKHVGYEVPLVSARQVVLGDVRQRFDRLVTGVSITRVLYAFFVLMAPITVVDLEIVSGHGQPRGE